MISQGMAIQTQQFAFLQHDHSAKLKSRNSLNYFDQLNSRTSQQEHGLLCSGAIPRNPCALSTLARFVASVDLRSCSWVHRLFDCGDIVEIEKRRGEGMTA
jgi:hypothetical protein